MWRGGWAASNCPCRMAAFCRWTARSTGWTWPQIDGRNVALILDYKRSRSGASFDWGGFYHGLDVQLAIYMLAVHHCGAGIADEVAGALCVPIETTPASATLAELADDEKPRKFPYKAGGVINGAYWQHLDPNAVKDSAFYNFFVKKDGDPYGKYDSSNILTPAHFARLLDWARDNIVRLATEIVSGRIELQALPSRQRARLHVLRVHGRLPLRLADQRLQLPAVREEIRPDREARGQMTDKRVNWTEQQKQAIQARGGNVFVTASAGTGKTAVLSGRCVSLVSDAALGPDVLNMLVLTFTEAAAEQMHARIAQQLREAYQQTRDTRLLRQLVLLQGANISTIHSFCKRIITEHFHKLSLDPSFRVIDADEAMLLKGETLEETIEWAWRQDHLVQGMHELLQRRDLRGSDGFLGSVIRLSEFLEGVVCAAALVRPGALPGGADGPAGQ